MINDKVKMIEVNMGSYNPNPGPEINPEQNQQQDIQQELNTEEKPVISRLINSVYFFIDCVYILQSKDKYRLVALHYGRVLCDKYYHTLRGCRIAFDKMFKHKAWREEVKANWSHFYDPDKSWLEENNSHLET
jgi:hypothetical protein